jgi:hypothetical protein
VRNQISSGEVADAKAFGLKASMYKIMPGKVVAYHAGVAGKSQPSVDVQPTVHDVRFDTTTGAPISEPWPVISKVPLAMAKGGGASVAFAMAKDDGVTLLSWDLDPTTYRATSNPSDPIDTRRHGGGHWVALPFDITDAGALPDPGGDMVLTPPTGGSVVLGPGATDFVALASLVDAAITALGTWAAGGTGSGYVVPVGTAKPVPNVAATLVKAK